MVTRTESDIQTPNRTEWERLGAPARSVEAGLRSRRIVFVLNDLNLGGAERQALLLARELKTVFGADVHVCALEGPAGRVSELCEDYGIPWRHFNIRFAYRRPVVIAAMARLAFELRRLKPNVLVPYITRPNILCGCVWRHTGARACVWNQRDAGLTRFGARLEQLAVRRTSWFVSNSTHAAEFLRAALEVPKDRLTVIPNGIEVPELAPSRHRILAGLAEVRESDFLACMVATLSEFKDHATLIRAWRIVADRWPGEDHPLLLLAGKRGETYELLRELTAELALQRHVHFLGEVKEVGALLQRADVSVFSSRSEGCPNGVLEAMASALPIVGTDIPGIREAVGPAGVPYLAPPGDYQGLAASVLRLAANRGLVHQLGQHNRNRVREGFSVGQLGQRTAGLLAGLVCKDTSISIHH